AVLGEDVIDGRSSARGVAFAEYLVEIARQQGRDAVGHGRSPIALGKLSGSAAVAFPLTLCVLAARSIALWPGRAHSGQEFCVATDRLGQALPPDPLLRPQDREDLVQDGGVPAEDGHDQLPARGREVDDPDPSVAGVLDPTD